MVLTHSRPAPAEENFPYTFQNVSIIKMDFISNLDVDESCAQKQQRKEKKQIQSENKPDPDRKAPSKRKNKNKNKKIKSLQTNPNVKSSGCSADESRSEDISVDSRLEGGSNQNES